MVSASPSPGPRGSAVALGTGGRHRCLALRPQGRGRDPAGAEGAAVRAWRGPNKGLRGRKKDGK